MNVDELKLEVVEQTLLAIMDNWRAGDSFSNLVGRIRERVGLENVKGLFETVQCAGGLSINNALPDKEDNRRVAASLDLLRRWSKDARACKAVSADCTDGYGKMLGQCECLWCATCRVL